jgi:hypothetical protein
MAFVNTRRIDIAENTVLQRIGILEFIVHRYSAMVKGVNQLFEQATAPFIYDQDIPFLTVDPSPDADHKKLLIHDKEEPAIQCWLPMRMIRPCDPVRTSTAISAGDKGRWPSVETM